MPSESESIDYLYDFIYADTRRISSYLSQIDPSGVITAIKEVVGESDNINTAGQLSVKVFRATLKGFSGNSQSLERQFDATPTLPWTLLHHLDEQSYLGKDLKNTPIGRIVSLKGSLRIVDLRLMKDVWKPNADVIRLQREAFLKSQKKEGALTNARHKEEEENLKKAMEYEFAITAMIEKLPHTANITFSTGQGRCWAATSGDNFLINPEELILKHGPDIFGTWHMAAIVDAKPEPQTQPPPDEEFEYLSDMILRSTKFIRYHFGRPANHYAVTPIAIYRAVEKPNP
jgi:hypothetical protein